MGVCYLGGIPVLQISGRSPELGCQFALAVARLCGDELENHSACTAGALERDGWAFPKRCLMLSVIVPGMLSRLINRSVRGRLQYLPKAYTRRDETRETTGEPKRFPTIRVQHAETGLPGAE